MADGMERAPERSQDELEVQKKEHRESTTTMTTATATAAATAMSAKSDERPIEAMASEMKIRSKRFILSPPRRMNPPATISVPVKGSKKQRNKVHAISSGGAGSTGNGSGVHTQSSGQPGTPATADSSVDKTHSHSTRSTMEETSSGNMEHLRSQLEETENDDEEEALLAQVSAVIGRRLQALEGKNGGDGEADGAADSHYNSSAGSGSFLREDSFIQRLSLLTGSALNGLTMQSSTVGGGTGTLKSASFDLHSCPTGVGSKDGAAGAFSSGKEYAGFFDASDGLDDMTTSLLSGTDGVSRLSWKSNYSTPLDQKTHGELVHAMERLREKLRSKFVELATERSRRKTREKNLIKLARQLGKNRQVIEKQAETIEQLENDLSGVQQQREQLQVEVEEKKTDNQKQTEQFRIDCERALKERHESHQLTCREHDRRMMELSTMHANQCEELCREVLLANQEVARLEAALLQAKSQLQIHQHQQPRQIWQLDLKEQQQRPLEIPQAGFLPTLQEKRRRSVRSLRREIYRTTSLKVMICVLLALCIMTLFQSALGPHWGISTPRKTEVPADAPHRVWGEQELTPPNSVQGMTSFTTGATEEQEMPLVVTIYDHETADDILEDPSAFVAWRSEWLSPWDKERSNGIMDPKYMQGSRAGDQTSAKSFTNATPSRSRFGPRRIWSNLKKVFRRRNQRKFN